MPLFTTTEPDLRAGNAELRARLEEAEETLRAIRAGEVDALVVETSTGPQVYVLQSTDADANRFRSDILAKVSDAIIAIDEDQCVTYLNAAAEHQYGVRTADALGRALTNLFETRWIHPDDGAEARAALDGTGHWRGENIHVKRSGEAIRVESSASRLFAKEGTPAGILFVVRDVTHEKRAEDALAEQARLLDLSFDAIFVRDVQNRITYWSKGAEDAYGFTREEALGQIKTELLKTDFPKPLNEILEELHRDGRWVGELRHTRKDGTVIIDSTRWALDRDPEGRPASVLETNNDVTERRRAESALRASEKKYRGLIQSLPAAVYTCDRRGRIELFNEAAIELWGREPEVGKDMWCGSWRIYHPDGSPLELDDCPMARTLKDGTAVRGEEIIVERPDGTRRHVLPYPDPIFDAAGEIVGAVNMLVDITDRKQIEVQLVEAKEAAEKANQTKDRFLAVLSHELRTPLTPVLMAVAALERDPGLRADVAEDLAMIKRNIELETKLIDDLLDLSRITSGKLPLSLEAVDLNEAVRQVCGICQSQLRERDIRLETEFDNDAGFVAADAARLQQVLWNVLKNAIKFTPEKGAICVTTKRLASARCEVRVRDSGIGISAEALPRIFDAFEQGDVSITREFGGLGLGLAICKALAERHGGSIRAESAGVGQGSTFIIELPGAVQSDVAMSPEVPPAQVGEPTQLRLLVVEDHADTARTLSRILRDAGFAVVTASDVAGAKTAAERERFDVLISDLGLPDGNGFEIMRAIGKERVMPGIAMSGYGMDEDVRRSREAGFTEHLVKPIEVPKLIAAIRRVTENRG